MSISPYNFRYGTFDVQQEYMPKSRTLAVHALVRVGAIPAEVPGRVYQ